MLTSSCSFPKGAIIPVEAGHKIFREFILEEELFQHTFQVMNNEKIDKARAAGEPAYYSAALMAERVKIDGVQVTPEIILGLHPVDGTYLLNQAAELEQRRDDFRSEIEAAAQGSSAAAEAGLQAS